MRALAALVLALVVACSASPAISPRDCTPGTTSACACPGALGVQTCGADGTLGACVCADAGVSREDAPSRPQDAPPVLDVGTDAPLPTLDAPGVLDGPTGPLDAPAADAPDVVDVPRDTTPPCEPRNLCGAVCVTDYQTDPQNCGACFISCPATVTGSVPTCRGGRCTLGCRAGFVTCGVGACVDPLAPTFDCAMCGFNCPEGQRCNYDGRRGTCVPR